ncbi:MAG: HAMP domain-containing sensor histidine kinase [Polyangiaceae bacterium]
MSPLRAESRISLGITLVAAIALAIALSLIHVYLNRFQEHQFDNALLEIARQEASEAAKNDFAFTTRPGPAANDVGPLDKYGVIYDGQGKVVAATEPFDVAAPNLSSLTARRGTPFDLPFRGKSLRGVVVAIAGANEHTLLLAASRDDLDGDDQFLKRAMVLAFVASLACMFLAALWLTNRFTRQHRRIALTLHRVARGDVLARVTGGSGDPDLEQWGQDLNVVAEQLSALIESQQQFVANAAHELRSPVAALYGQLQQSLRKPRSGDEYQTFITHALNSTRRLKRLADDLLTLARAEHETEPFERVRLADVLEELRRELAPVVAEKQVELDAHVGDTVVHGRAADIQRLLRNLVDNAIRHSPPGGTVRCDASVEGERVIVRVADDGPGVAPDERERIFEPFFRSALTRGTAREGSGLGLSIAREIARAHGGEVRIEQALQGAVFTAELRSAAAVVR